MSLILRRGSYFVDFAKSLGLPDMTKLKDVFNFNMNTIILNKVLEYLDKVGLSKLKTKIVTILKEVEVSKSPDTIQE